MPEIVFSNPAELFEFIVDAWSVIHQEPWLEEAVVQYRTRVGESSTRFHSLLPEFHEFLTETRLDSTSADESRIYIDGCWDIMHSGHFNAIRQAKLLGKTLVVGVHSDEEIIQNKGYPVMNYEERAAMVSACKWVDEVVLDAPYSPTLEWLDRNNCKYIAHGDDVAINSHGFDAYGELKRSGRFKVIKRTEGISTTALVGKLLLMTRQVLEGLEEPMIASSTTEFLTTSRRIREFANTSSTKPQGRVVYVDGSFDLFHIGHVETLKKAKDLGDFLIVGIHDDATVNRYKGFNFPIMNLHERALNVMAIKYVDEVIIGTPWIVTEDLIKSLNVSVVVQGTVSKLDTELGQRCKEEVDLLTDPYAYPKSRNMYFEVTSERDIETQDIIQRIIDHRLKHLSKFNKSSQKEATYYQNKTYVEEI